MAKRKKSKGGARRRRIGAALNAGNPLVKVAAVAVGYFVAAKPVNDMLDKVVAGRVSDKIVGIGQTGLGALLLMSKKPSLIKTAAGGIAAGAGLKRALSAFGVTAPSVPAPAAPAVTGYGSVPVVGAIGGYGSVPTIGSYETPGTLGAYVMQSGKLGTRSKVMGGIGATSGSDLIGNN